jgi:two-component system, NarL family, invasion response regulator UvrY
MIRVYLVDDHALVRSGFRSIIERETDLSVVGEAGDGETALVEVRRLKPDVVLCDLHMPGLSGLDVTERIARGSSSAKVIVVTVQGDGPMPKRLLAAGASGYVLKACPQEELLAAIRSVARGKRFIAPELAQQLALESVEGATSPFDALSEREVEVALLLVQGLKNGDIAERLHLSPKTVSTHKTRLLQKLAVPDVLGLARLARQFGLLDPGQA